MSVKKGGEFRISEGRGKLSPLQIYIRSRIAIVDRAGSYGSTNSPYIDLRVGQRTFICISPIEIEIEILF
jgi:hypothetical protein